MSNTIVFTEIIGCAKVGRIMLKTFHHFHDHPIYIFATQKDIMELGEDVEWNKNNIFIDVTKDVTLQKLYETGHQGTAYLFAKVLSGEIGKEYENFSHIDSDCVLKKESLSLIEREFENGYDIVGSRRCYVNNPADIKVPEGIPDTVSTFFFGMKRSAIPKQFNFVELMALASGADIGLGHMIFDFFDPITFHALRSGAKIKFIDSNLIGGQNEQGSKVNNYLSNLHLDMGSHLLHFGGAGSGCVYASDKKNQNKSYGDWAEIRYHLFCDLFYDEVFNDLHDTKPVYSNGRWVSGSYDNVLVQQIRKDIGDPVFHLLSQNPHKNNY